MTRRMTKPGGALLIALAAAASTALALGVSGAFSSDGSTAATPVIGEDIEPAAGAEVATHVQQTIDGQTWSINTYKNADGKLCFAQQVPGEGQGITCLAPGEAFKDGPVWFGVGARQRDAVDLTAWDTIWVDGLVSDEVATLDL